MNRILPAMIAIMAMTLGSSAQQATDKADKNDSMKDCPMHEQHEAATLAHDHSKHALDKRGDQGMGFAQDKTTHHFLLRLDGGAIQVTANSTTDKKSREEIQMHLRHIARAFQSGDFNIPMFVHDQTPPGVPAMARLKDQIKYRYESAENGGRVVISSANAEAVKAIHEFLKFQINEHKTGDSLEVK
jgi:glycerophosphoryl diester phosphodiesterase